jgi:hypothetical protein
MGSGGATATLGGAVTLFFFFLPTYGTRGKKKKKKLFLIPVLKFNEELKLELCQILQLNI